VNERRLRRWLAWAFASWALACASRAHGQSSAGASEGAQVLFEKGLRAYESGSVEAALDQFHKSLELYPTPAAWKNAALCLRELGRYDEALDLLEAFPRRFPDLPADEVRNNALKIEELSNQVGWVELRGVQPSSRYSVDDRERGVVPADSRVRVSSGLHRVRVSKEGMDPTEVSVAAQSGQTIVAEIDQRPAAAPSPSAWMLGVELGGALTSSLGGDVAGCSPCDRGLAGGGRAIAHVGHALGPKMFLSLDAGYLMVAQNIDHRQDAVVVASATNPVTGTSSDDLSMRGALLGVSLGYRLPFGGDSYARVGAGSFLGWVRDERLGHFDAMVAPGTSYPLGQTQLQPASYGYLSAAIGLGFRPASHVRLGAGVDAIGMVAFRQPQWDSTCDACKTAGRDGESYFTSAAMAGSFIVLVSPFVEAGYAF
jgi:hypothetical protein